MICEKNNHAHTPMRRSLVLFLSCFLSFGRAHVSMPQATLLREYAAMVSEAEALNETREVSSFVGVFMVFISSALCLGA